MWFKTIFASCLVLLTLEQQTFAAKTQLLSEAKMQKIPYLLIVGDKEIQSNAVSVRQRGKGDLGQMQLDTFLEKVKGELRNKI